ncbi:NAD(P)-dependent oxidoreductase [Ktedonospora formicarum]|uniref:3-hydroxyisobutyrate dehydrogenase n=1 Tax=Ktedonospora formicarum TaxID=2778364 RepID=A0A8J3IAW7_9CHLR|nr:NAD(P)-dependent oxidoreductase [Ktedonospora formicarum]GHO48933.1 3-hydroxyisobutyrate dehydrogenase [Ktedonospora formicarum]
MSQSVGFIGLGSMGQPMVRNLLKAGYHVKVYNRSESRASALVDVGAIAVSSPAEVVEVDGMVVTMVSNDAALEDVTLGAQGLLERLGSGGIHISMSTVSPDLAYKLAELHKQRGSSYIAAPVFGRPQSAAAAQLKICVAGSSIAKERTQPVLQALGQPFDFGEQPKQANVIKLCGNFMIISAIEAMGEALTLVEKNGMDRSAVMSLFTQTLFACPIYQTYGPLIAEQRFTPPGFQLQWGLKDINFFLDNASQVYAPLPLAHLVQNRLLSSVAKGRGESDLSRLTQAISEDAGLEVVP